MPFFESVFRRLIQEEDAGVGDQCDQKDRGKRHSLKLRLLTQSKTSRSLPGQDGSCTADWFPCFADFSIFLNFLVFA
jgi:hypothetical protein